MKKKWKCIVAGICLSAVLAACGAADTAGSDSADAAATGVTETAKAASTYTDSVPVQEYLTISTDFGDLYYPDQWEEFVQIDEEKGEGYTTLFFKALIDNKEYELFDIQIGGESESESAGEITAQDGTVSDIYISMKEIEDTADLTEGETDRLYAMQEDVNYIIDNLK